MVKLIVSIGQGWRCILCGLSTEDSETGRIRSSRQGWATQSLSFQRTYFGDRSHYGALAGLELYVDQYWD